MLLIFLVIWFWLLFIVLFSGAGSRYRIKGQGSLYINNVTEADAGTYICRATNLEDSADSEASLVVHGKWIIG